MYLLCLFVWSSDGAEKNGAQTQALPHGLEQISRSPAATRKGGLRNTLPVCWGSWLVAQQKHSWRQEARMKLASSHGAITLSPHVILL